MKVALNMLKLLRCPVTGQELEHVDPELLTRINEAISSGNVTNSIGESVSQPLSAETDGGLVNSDKTFLYPIRDEIINLVADELIELDQL